MMEQVKHYELLLLISVRNNSKIPVDEFYKVFDNNWHVYSNTFWDLATRGLIRISPLGHLQGSYKYELTKKGNLRIMELINERSNAIDLKLVQLKYKRDSSIAPGISIFSKISGFFTQISSRFTHRPSGDI
jgi:hypothetical protein